MTNAIGIHAHPTRKLGRRPTTPARPSLKLGSLLTGKLPAHPPVVDYFSGETFGMYDNDKFGVCGPTFVANDRRLITKRLKGQMIAPSQDDVFDLYRRSGNPNFNPNLSPDDPKQEDNGVDMQTMLQAVMTGGIGGVKCLGYAKVDVSNQEELKAAIAIFGSLGFGVDLETAQQNQTDSGTWFYSPSGDWGGHCILGGAYESGDIKVISWAEIIKMLSAFIRHQLQEAWVVIWPEHLSDNTFLNGINLKALQSDFKTLTGRPFPHAQT